MNYRSAPFLTGVNALSIAILFDCDGTLIDSEPICNAVLSDLLTRHGLPMTSRECMQAFVGTNLNYVVRWAKEQRGVELPSDFHDQVRPAVRERCSRELVEIHGARELVASLEHPKAVVSNSGVDYLRFTLGHVGILSYFEPHIYSAQMVERSKPAPDVYLFAAKALGVDPKRCLVVEDTVLGTMAGIAAGMTVASLSAGEHADEAYTLSLRKAGATHIITSLAQVKDIARSMLESKV